MAGEDEERLHAWVPKSLKRLMDADDRSIKEVVTAALWQEYGGKRKSALEAQKEQKEIRLESVRDEIEVLREEEAELEREVRNLEEAIETAEDDMGYEDDVKALFNEFANSRAVLPRFRSDAKDIADEHGKSLAEIEQDLKELGEESDYEIAEERWTDRMGSGLE